MDRLRLVASAAWVAGVADRHGQQLLRRYVVPGVGGVVRLGQLLRDVLVAPAMRKRGAQTLEDLSYFLRSQEIRLSLHRVFRDGSPYL